MNKTVSIVLIATLSVVFLASCSSSTNETEGVKQTINVGIHNNEIIMISIKKVADATGWNITEFKSNEVIAEKTTGDKTLSSIIKIYDGQVKFENDDANELYKALDAEIGKE